MNPIDPAELRRGQFHFLAARAPNRVLVSVLAGILGGIAYAMLVPLILLSLASVDPTLSEFVDDATPAIFGWEIQHWRFAAVIVQFPFTAVRNRTVGAQRDVIFPNMVMVERPAGNPVINLLSTAFCIVGRKTEIFQMVP